MKKIKKLFSFMLSFLLAMGLFVFPSYAQEAQAVTAPDKSLFVTDYPYIFVHGMGGWGENDPQYIIMP